jgi:hypothetical protein
VTDARWWWIGNAFAMLSARAQLFKYEYDVLQSSGSIWQSLIINGEKLLQEISEDEQGYCVSYIAAYGNSSHC